MIETSLNDREEEVVPRTTPHLSHSRISRYLHCPEQYRLYYLEGLRPRVPSASLVFGQVVHQALSCCGQCSKHCSGHNGQKQTIKVNPEG